ncbi:Protein N-acetyltransferase, RimJ/RimL family [Clostridium cavendishii DSM 21758]|uniref:Protein N-acetyltransferase, RimJ/RimL family n=1 Tax=Clostridium cavendishii DSM 21758 TaxID=1121302 RepID=A0A1M6QX47_9CLOT|nr:GNAT family N-acetyltransferase [Clostridium cavendishii]SHK24852.1 Protein N-acetyltransferase, RimJ/RimL family [Clostridium cavendishii DSM 21758]
MKIETERLLMIPMTYEFIVDKLEGKQSSIEENGVKIIKEYWQESDIIDILPMIKDYLKDKEPDGFTPWLIILKKCNRVIGSCGCHGEPNQNNEVEIGYGIDSDCRRNGYATEAVKGLVSWLFEKKKVNNITAECNIDNMGSIKVLKNIGMIEIKRDEELIYWNIN